MTIVVSLQMSLRAVGAMLEVSLPRAVDGKSPRISRVPIADQSANTESVMKVNQQAVNIRQSSLTVLSMMKRLK